MTTRTTSRTRRYRTPAGRLARPYAPESCLCDVCAPPEKRRRTAPRRRLRVRRSTAHRPRRRRLGIATCRCLNDAPCPPSTSHGASTLLTLRRGEEFTEHVPACLLATIEMYGRVASVRGASACHTKQRGEFGEAQACYIRAIELDPEVPPAPPRRARGGPLTGTRPRLGILHILYWMIRIKAVTEIPLHSHSPCLVVFKNARGVRWRRTGATWRSAASSSRSGGRAPGVSILCCPFWLTFTYVTPVLVKKY
jgi:hypothetical protein